MHTATRDERHLSTICRALLTGLSLLTLATSSFAFATLEHEAIGNQTILTLANGERVSGQQAQLVLASGMTVSYGEAGYMADYLGAPERLIDPHENLTQQRAAFMDNFAVFYQGGHYVANVRSVTATILSRNQEHINNKERLSTSLLDELAYDRATGAGLFKRGIYFQLGMSASNANHFAENALTAYGVGHGIATGMAAEAGKEQDPAVQQKKLKLAYLINGYANHYLQDVFAAGHGRVPRLPILSYCRAQLSGIRPDQLPFRALMETLTQGSTQPSIIADAISLLLIKEMHGQDGDHGLRVRNQRGDVYDAYGDNLLFAQQNGKNKDYLALAVQYSADDIYLAYTTQRDQVPDRVYPLTPDFSRLHDLPNPPALFTVSADGTGLVQYHKDGGYTDLNCASALLDLYGNKEGIDGI